MQFIGAEGSGMSLLVKITSESEVVGGRAGGAGWGRGASGFRERRQRFLRSCRVKRYGNRNRLRVLGRSSYSLYNSYCQT